MYDITQLMSKLTDMEKYNRLLGVLEEAFDAYQLDYESSRKEVEVIGDKEAMRITVRPLVDDGMAYFRSAMVEIVLGACKSTMASMYIDSESNEKTRWNKSSPVIMVSP